MQREAKKCIGCGWTTLHFVFVCPVHMIFGLARASDIISGGEWTTTHSPKRKPVHELLCPHSDRFMI